jgi:threonine dehydratase
MSNTPTLPLADIQATRDLLAPHIVRTPIHQWQGRELSERAAPGTQVVLKLELFQHTGTFKARGALSNTLRLDADQITRGITAVSAGNHAIAAAFAAQKVGASAKVVMMASANPARVQRAKAFGAEVLIASDGKSAFELARKIEQDEGRTFVHPFEGLHTSLGTGTLGAEWIEQAPDLDAVIIPIGGGGLISGMAAAIKQINPNIKVYGVEPVGADSITRSLAQGSPVDSSTVTTIADSLGPPYALPFSFGLIQQYVDEVVLIDDDQIRESMGVLFREMKLAVEPAGAAATAALFGPLRDKLAGQRMGVLVCGANIDAAGFAGHLAMAQERDGLV